MTENYGLKNWTVLKAKIRLKIMNYNDTNITG